MQRIIM